MIMGWPRASVYGCEAHLFSETVQVDAFTQVSKNMLTDRLYLSTKGKVGEQPHGYGICIGSRSETRR